MDDGTSTWNIGPRPSASTSRATTSPASRSPRPTSWPAPPTSARWPPPAPTTTRRAPAPPFPWPGPARINLGPISRYASTDLRAPRRQPVLHRGLHPRRARVRLRQRHRPPLQPRGGPHQYRRAHPFLDRHRRAGPTTSTSPPPARPAPAPRAAPRPTPSRSLLEGVKGFLDIKVDPYLIADAANGATYTLTAVVTPAEAGPDTDGDGVPDAEDACPTTPGTGPDGCPVPANEQVHVSVDGTRRQPRRRHHQRPRRLRHRRHRAHRHPRAAHRLGGPGPGRRDQDGDGHPHVTG